MTIRIPEPTIADRILGLLGKKRAVSVPGDVYREYGKYAYGEATRESFWTALFRRKNEQPPEGWLYPEVIKPGRE